MRHSMPGVVATASTENPAATRASNPDCGEPEAQPTTSSPPSAVASTTTVTPSSPGQAPAVWAAAFQGPTEGAGARSPTTRAASGHP